MIKRLKIFNRDKKNYKLVTIRKYDGAEAYFQTWTFLSYAVVEDIGDNKAVCFRDKNIMYEYMPILKKNSNNKKYDYSGIKIGDIRIFLAKEESFSKISMDSNSINSFIQNSDLYFDDDTKYGTKKNIYK